MNIGFVGAGGFAKGFVPLFKLHPLVDKVYITDLIPERREEYAAKFDIRTFESFDVMLESDIDSVAIFTQRHLHGPLAIKALKSGKHVYSAVPMANEICEIQEIVDLAARKNLIYMTGETAYYYPGAIFCRAEMKKGSFGDFVYAEAQYYHDMNHGFYDVYKRSGSENWKKVAGIPPMYYPTHSIGALVSATGAHVIKTSCFGFRDTSGDGVFGEGMNYWDNPFSNETALLYMSNGGVCRANEFRRIGIKKSTSYISCFYGTRASYEEAFTEHVFMEADETGKKIKFRGISGLLNSRVLEEHRGDPDFMERVANGEYDHRSSSPIMNTGRLPAEFKPEMSGHRGVPKFLVDDFVKAVNCNKLPPNNAWDSARYNIPGLIAHESVVKGGALIDVPDLGDPPEGWDMLDPDSGI